MEFRDIVTIVTACIVSAGGVGGVIVFAVKFCSNFIAERLSAKYEIKLQEELEKKKSINERKNYISKVRFDKELEIYQTLSEKHIALVYDIGESVLFARGMYMNKTDETEEFIERFTKSCNEADMSLKKHGCFISKEIFEQYRELDKMGSNIYKLSLFLYETHFGFPNTIAVFCYQGKQYNIEAAKSEIERLQKIVSDLSDQIIDQIREYLNSLDVI